MEPLCLTETRRLPCVLLVWNSSPWARGKGMEFLFASRRIAIYVSNGLRGMVGIGLAIGHLVIIAGGRHLTRILSSFRTDWPWLRYLGCERSRLIDCCELCAGYGSPYLLSGH